MCFEGVVMGEETSVISACPVLFSASLGLIFVVDSNDRERVNEAREELMRMLAEDELRDAVLLVFANKQVRCLPFPHLGENNLTADTMEPWGSLCGKACDCSCQCGSGGVQAVGVLMPPSLFPSPGVLSSILVLRIHVIDMFLQYFYIPCCALSDLILWPCDSHIYNPATPHGIAVYFARPRVVASDPEMKEKVVVCVPLVNGCSRRLWKTLSYLCASLALQDLPNAMNAAEITDKLGLHSLRHRNWYIQATCATSGDGLYEGLDWLANQLKNKK